MYNIAKSNDDGFTNYYNNTKSNISSADNVNSQQNKFLDSPIDSSRCKIDSISIKGNSCNYDPYVLINSNNTISNNDICGSEYSFVKGIN